MDKIKIGFDIDGVALQYTERMAEVFELFGGKSNLIGTKEFNFFSAIKEEEHKALYLAFGYMMNQILPLHSDFEAMIKFIVKERQQKLHFITARQKNLSCDSAVQSLENAMSYMGISPSLMSNVLRVDCVGEGGVHGSKVPKIQEYGMEYFVEDRRKNVLEIASTGVIVFMPRRSWNKLPEDTENVIQYDHCSEIVKYLRRACK